MMTLPIFTSTLILLAGVVDDLRSRKFHNWLFLVCCAIGITVVLITGGVSGLFISALGFGAGVALFLPLVLFRIVGAGDMKLLAAFGILAGWNTVFSVAVLSLIWGAIFGVVRTMASGQTRVLIGNLAAIVTLKKREQLVLHSMPFTFAILMAWLTHLVLARSA
jgi:prepilin peptidase CpaA